MKYWYYILFIFCGVVHAQGDVGYLFEEYPRDSVKLDVKTHTSVLPQIRMQNHELDTNGSASKLNLEILGLADLGYRYSNETQYRAGAGFMFAASLKNKWYMRAGIIQGAYSSDSIFPPKSFISSVKKDHVNFSDLRLRMSYTPNSIFNFQIGLDQNFIGEGSRSLFLSDYGVPYPFAMIRTKFWRIEYAVMYQFYREQLSNSSWKLKNGATHYLSYNINKRINLGIFETVVFQPKDTLLYRGFDAEYLNPVVFYRPQEYSMGSSDNVLLGASLTISLNKAKVYSQFILDEFYLSEIKAKSQWWANKFGAQLGIKGRFDKRKQHFFYRGEFNFVRPFTYAHLNSGQNYGNQGYTLAHPYGANFYELLSELKWNSERWMAKCFASYFLQGWDKDSLSYGGDIYQSYVNRPGDYGNFIGQGKGNNGFRFQVFVGYEIWKKSRMYLFAEYQLRYDSAIQATSHVPMIGLRSQLWNDYRNY